MAGTCPNGLRRSMAMSRPALDWSGAPDGTKSYALIVEDPDASIE
ncbi:hypothetical protein GG804_22140 [Sphingomonas histidinilytica]|nr:hypothetical protein [Rhizorhabdus histidinilytica]